MWSVDMADERRTLRKVTNVLKMMLMRHRGSRFGRLPRLLPIVGALVVLAMLVVACGSEEDVTGGTGSGSAGDDSGPTPTVPASPAPPTEAPSEATPDASPTTGEIAHPTGEDEVILRIAYEGGFVMPEMLVTRLPIFSLSGDGCYVVEGPRIEIYPQPALPNLLETCLTEEGVQTILQAAQEAGLLDGDAQYPLDLVADAPTTVFTVTANGETSRVEAYALGIDTDPAANDFLTEEEAEARAKLAEFVDKITDLRSWLPAVAFATEEQFFEIERLQVVAQPAEIATGGATPEGIEIQQREWPLETPIAELGEEHFLEQARCFVLEGEELQMLLPALEDANELTQWTSGDEQYQLFLRPLLADEEGCPAGV